MEVLERGDVREGEGRGGERRGEEGRGGEREGRRGLEFLSAVCEQLKLSIWQLYSNKTGIGI